MTRPRDVNARIEDHPVLGPRRRTPTVTFTWNGATVEAVEGEPIAAALLAAGVLALRTSERARTARGIFCNIGHCYECRVVVNGQRDVRACITLVYDGMVVTTQSNDPDKELCS